MKLAVLVPVLGRPHRVEPLVASIRAATPLPHRVMFIADAGDGDEIRAVQECAGADLLVVGGAQRWSYARKINAAARATTEPLLFTGADDLAFRTGWLDAALSMMRGDVSVVGVNDLGTARVREGRHATSFLVRRGYLERGTVDEPGLLMHEGYHHNFPDDELVETARARGSIAFATDAVVEHLHPHFGRAEDDPTYALGRSHFREDRNLFLTRRRLWRG